MKVSWPDLRRLLLQEQPYVLPVVQEMVTRLLELERQYKLNKRYGRERRKRRAARRRAYNQRLATLRKENQAKRRAWREA